VGGGKERSDSHRRRIRVELHIRFRSSKSDVRNQL